MEQEERQIESDQPSSYPFPFFFNPLSVFPFVTLAFPGVLYLAAFGFSLFDASAFCSCSVIPLLSLISSFQRYSGQVFLEDRDERMVLSWYLSAHFSMHSDSSFFVSSPPLNACAGVFLLPSISSFA